MVEYGDYDDRRLALELALKLQKGPITSHGVTTWTGQTDAEELVKDAFVLLKFIVADYDEDEDEPDSGDGGSTLTEDYLSIT